MSIKRYNTLQECEGLPTDCSPGDFRQRGCIEAEEGWLVTYTDHLAAQAMPIEVNGPANIIMLIDVAQQLGQPVNLEAIRAEAVRTIRYLEALGRGERPKWYEVPHES